MNRVGYVACALLALFGSQELAAAPLVFGAFDAEADLRESEAVRDCAATSSGQTCALTRKLFGGLPIDSGAALLNGEGRLIALRITLAAGDYDAARQLLIGRYGAPERWRSFDDGATLQIERAKPSAVITFSFPANRIAATPREPDARLVSSFLLFASVGLGAGFIMRQRRRAGTAGALPDAQPSMRATLERRLKEGRELRF